MSKYRTKEIVEASQWLKHGDHPEVILLEYYNYLQPCPDCGHPFCEHGSINDEDSCPIRVCPGDWIIEGIEDPTVVTDKVFHELYEKVGE